MPFPLGTGQLARLLNTTEPKLAEAVRKGRVVPAPRIVAGRRAWDLSQVHQAAQLFGLEPADLISRVAREVSDDPQ